MKTNPPPPTTLRVFPGTGFVSSYAGTEYLIRELMSHGLKVEILMRPPAAERPKYQGKGLIFRFGVNWSGVVPAWLRRPARAWERGRVLLQMLASRAILITESAHLREAALAKRIRGRKLLLIHYAQELLLPEELPESGDALFYQRYSRFADVTIDVEEQRAAIRKTKMHLTQPALVLPNTLPLQSLPERSPRGGLGRLAGVDIPDNRVVVFYAGVQGPNKPFHRIVEAFARICDRGFLVAFCGGGKEILQEAIASASRRLPAGTWAVCPPVPRGDILSCSWEADIGIVDYSPSLEATTNQLYCAPTKLFEYMAAGLAVVGSDNPSLRNIVEREIIGQCAAGGSSADLGAALERAADGNLAEMKRRSRKMFEEKYSYERICAPAVAQLARRIQGLP